MYNDEFNNNDMYRFTNRDMPRDDYAPAPRQENTPAVPAQRSGFFHRTWVKITALVLACVVAGGAAGYGGAALAKGGSGSGTAIKESDRTVTAVEVKKVDISYCLTNGVQFKNRAVFLSAKSGKIRLLQPVFLFEP